MFMTSSSHDRGVNTFSREGRIFQIEYATKAVNLSSTAIGVTFKDGAVLVVEKKTSSPLMISSSVEKLVEIDHHVACGIAGLVADSKMLVKHARSEAQNHTFSYGEPAPIRALAETTCDLLISFGEDGRHAMSRPFGVALLLAGVDRAGPALYHLDPAGTFALCKARAIGAGHETAQNRLCADYVDDMDLEAALGLSLRTLREVMEAKMSARNIEVTVVARDEHGVVTQHRLSEEDLRQRIEALA